MKTLGDETCRSEILQRIHSLSTDSLAQWGRMTVGQMVCHLTDSFGIGRGERSAESVSSWWGRTGLKWIALRLPLPWPKSLPTRPEVDPLRDGTKPKKLPEDLRQLESALEDFIDAVNQDRCGEHPMMGALSGSEWLRWGYLHADHHLRQFGT